MKIPTQCDNMNRTILHLFSILIIFGNAGHCIIWYDGEPVQELLQYEAVVAAPEPFVYTVLTSKIEHKSAVRQGLNATGVFDTLVPQYSVQAYQKDEGGTAPYFLEVKVGEKRLGGLGVIWTYLTWYLAAGLLPGWTEDGLAIEYKLLKYEPSTQKYVGYDSEIYDTTRWSVSWLGLAPFFWVNFLTHSKEDVISLTAQDYVAKLTKKGKLSALVDPSAMQPQNYTTTVVLKSKRVLTNVVALVGYDTITAIDRAGQQEIFARDQVARILR